MSYKKVPENLPILWEICLSLLYNESYIKGLNEFFRNKRIKKILDCACGTGFPSIELSKLDYNVTCSDGDTEMLKRFKKNMLNQKLNLKTIHCEWQDLDKHFQNEFDCVLCRGNSLVYAISWGKKELNPVKAKLEIVKSLENFYNVLRKEGFCYIDVPPKAEYNRQNNSGYEKYTKRKINGQEISLSWKVIQQPEMKMRTWIPEITLWNSGPIPVRKKFVYKSYLIDHQELLEMLNNIGFSKIKTYQKIKGENTYDIFIAYK